jgi:hypothetical protein
MKNLIEQLKEEINEAYDFFDGEAHFDDAFEQAGFDEDNLRIFDCGYIKGMECALSRLLEIYQEDE